MSSSLHMFHGTYQMLRDPSKDPCARFHLNQSVIMWLFIPPSTDGPIALGQNDRPSKTDSTVVTATPKDGNIQKWFDGSNIWPISLFFSCFFFYDLTHHMSTSHVHITCPSVRAGDRSWPPGWWHITMQPPCVDHRHHLWGMFPMKNGITLQ